MIAAGWKLFFNLAVGEFSNLYRFPGRSRVNRPVDVLQRRQVLADDALNSFYHLVESFSVCC